MTNTRFWHPIGLGTPLNAWLETKREGEEGTNLCIGRITAIGEEPEWIEKSGRTTVTHHSFVAPTHWRWPAN